MVILRDCFAARVNRYHLITIAARSDGLWLELLCRPECSEDDPSLMDVLRGAQ